MAYQSLFTGRQTDVTVRNIIEPTKFEGRATSENGSPHTMVAGEWQDVNFIDTAFVASGDFGYSNGILTYFGDNPIELTMNLSVSILCDTINTSVHLAQWKSNVEDAGAENVSKAESNVSLIPFSIDTPFSLVKNETLNLRLYTDKDCIVTLYHFSVVLETNKITVV